MTDLRQAPPERTGRSGRAAGAHRTTGRRMKLTTVAALAATLVVGVAYANARPSRPVLGESPLRPGEVALWNASVTPRLPADSDTKAVELGTKFSSAVPGTVSAILFYKHLQNAGPHGGSLWDDSGRRIATVRFGAETASGWQVARLATPVAVAAGRSYVVSYNSPSGKYADDTNYFGAGHSRTVGALTATAGVYRYGATSAMPTGVWAGSNYYVDVAFTPGNGGPVTTPSAQPDPAPPSASPIKPAPPSASRPAPSGTGTAPAPRPSGPADPGPGRNCGTTPSACGFPDASNTGVQSGVALRSVPGQVTKGTGWHWDNGHITVDGAGAVLENISVEANVDVTASGVTVRNVRITTGGEDFGISLRHTKDVTIENTEISGRDGGPGRLMVGIKDIYGDDQGTRVLRSDIAGTSTGIQIYAGLIQDNYIHDMGFKSGDHTNGTTDNGGSRSQLTLRHNTVLNSQGQTDAISLFQDFGTQTNRTIENNLVAGGGYTIYGGANPGGAQTSNIRIVNNHFSRIYFAKGGYYGPATAFDARGPGNEWSGNVWDDTGAAVPAP
jgi:uncharacterized protein DUF4082